MGSLTERAATVWSVHQWITHSHETNMKQEDMLSNFICWYEKTNKQKKKQQQQAFNHV